MFAMGNYFMPAPKRLRSEVSPMTRDYTAINYVTSLYLPSYSGGENRPEPQRSCVLAGCGYGWLERRLGLPLVQSLR